MDKLRDDLMMENMEMRSKLFFFIYLILFLHLYAEKLDTLEKKLKARKELE